MFVIRPDELEYRQVNKGLSQGGVISPTLYAIYTRRITENVDCQCKVLQYADEIAIYISGKKITDLLAKLEKAVLQVDNNLIRLGLKIQSEKAQMVDYNKRSIIDRNIIMPIHNYEIRCQNFLVQNFWE